MMDCVLLLAQATSNPTAAPAPDLMRNMVPLLLIGAVFMFIMFRGQKKDRDKFQQMLNSLKRNDRVQTIGGILATVVEVRDNEVVLKVDETNNVKMRFNRSAIKEILAEAPAGEK